VKENAGYILLCKMLKYFPLHGAHAVAQLVEALRYKPEGRGFDFHGNFLLK